MTYIHELTVDVANRSALSAIRVKQSDTNRYIKITMTANGSPIVPSSGDSAVFRCKKPDQHSCYDTAVINSDGTISVKLTAQALAVAGEVQADISIYNGSNILSTANFIILVEAMPFNGNTAPSSDEYAALAGMVARGDEILSEASGYADRAEAAAEQAEENYAHKEGDYPGLNSGNLTDTTYTENSDPYTFRKTPSDAVSTEKVKEIVGASVGWNQLVNNGDFSNGTTGWTTQNTTVSASNNTADVSVTETSDPYIEHWFSMQADHVFMPLLTVAAKAGNSGKYSVRVFYNGTSAIKDSSLITTSYVQYSAILKQSTTATSNRLRVSLRTTAVAGDGYYLRNAQIIDLTAMFGTTIADYIYSLETATAGAGVEWIRENCPSLLSYHEYDAGSIKSVNVSGHRTVGFNQFDGLWDYKTAINTAGAKYTNTGSVTSSNLIKVFEGQTYYFNSIGSDKTLNLYLQKYDAGGGYIGYAQVPNSNTITISSGTAYVYLQLNLRGETSQDDVADINFSFNFSDPAKNGTYEPYHGITYPVTQTDLRGVFSLSDGKLVANGDVYSASGQVTRKYGIAVIDGSLTPVEDNITSSMCRVFYSLNNCQPFTSLTGDDVSIISNYLPVSNNAATYNSGNRGIHRRSNGTSQICVSLGVNSGITTLAAFKEYLTAHPVTVVYPLATPTTETLDPYAEEQYCSPYGTEEWVGSDVPVGHVTEYASNDNDKLKTLMGAAGADGIYFVSQQNGVMSLLFAGSGAGFHNSLFRGMYLGDHITDAQNEAIKNRTYDGLFVGDYWTIGGVNYRIAAIEYYINCGDLNLSVGHLVVVPDGSLYAYAMNSTNDTTGGYSQSDMRTNGLAQARTTIAAAFGSHVKSHRVIMTNTTASGKPSAWAWMNSDGIELMNEQQVYGARAWGDAAQNGFDVGTQKMQFPLFLYAPRFVNTRQNYWLQDVRSASLFACVYDHGNAYANGASLALGVRPAITLSYT